MNGALLVFSGSLAGVLLLVLVSYLLGLGRDARIADEAEARELADTAVCGLRSIEVVLDEAGAGAAPRWRRNVLLLRAAWVNSPHAARRAARVTREGGRLTIASSDGTFRVATLELGDAAEAWAARLDALDS